MEKKKFICMGSELVLFLLKVSNNKYNNSSEEMVGPQEVGQLFRNLHHNDLG